MSAFARGVGELEMTVEVASRAGPGERRSRCAEETATVPREVAAPQATLDALLCELLDEHGLGVTKMERRKVDREWLEKV